MASPASRWPANDQSKISVPLCSTRTCSLPPAPEPKSGFFCSVLASWSDKSQAVLLIAALQGSKYIIPADLPACVIFNVARPLNSCSPLSSA